MAIDYQSETWLDGYETGNAEGWYYAVQRVKLPTALLRPELPWVQVSQLGNANPHDFRTKPGETGIFCLACLKMRPIDRSLDLKPCKGIAKLSLRETGVSLSPDEEHPNE